MSILNEATEIGMSEEQVNAIMGSLLGDGCLRKCSDRAKGLRWNHGEKQMEYLQWKYRALSEFARREPYTEPNPGYGSTWAILELRSLGILHSLHTLLYPNGAQRKTVTMAYLSEITHPIALAWWFMDDGTRQAGYNTGKICTNGFSQEENELLADWLLYRWGVTCSAQKVKQTNGNDAWHLILPVEGYISLMRLIAPFVPECMAYKTELVMRTCAHCGKEMPLQGHSDCCSEECRVAEQKARKQAYYQAHKPEPRPRPAALERDERLARRREQRAERMQDPEYRAQVAKWNKAYYDRMMTDEERHQRVLAKHRERMHTDEAREKSREYLRRRRAQLRAENPEAQAAHDALMARRAEVAAMTPEEKAADRAARAKARRAERAAAMTPEEREAARQATNAYMRERYHAMKAKEGTERGREASRRHRATRTDAARRMESALKQLCAYRAELATCTDEARRTRLVELVAKWETTLAERREEVYRERAALPVCARGEQLSLF